MRTQSSTGELCPEPEGFGPVKPFLEHLEDLRWVLVRCLVGVILGTLACFTAADRVMEIVMGPLAYLPSDAVPKLEQRGPSAPFAVVMKVGLYGGIGLSLPIVAGVLIAYLFPALRSTERAILWRAVLIGGGLFALGAAAAYGIVTPVILTASVRFSAWLGLSASVWFVEDYVGFVLQLLVGMGLAFEVPLLRRGRPYAVLGNLIISAFLTPADFVSCLMLAVPLQALYEIGLWFASRSEGGDCHPSTDCQI